MTILGDIAQGIYSYKGTSNWNDINNKIFNSEANIEFLQSSYRTTFEIMTEANKILSKISEKENLKLAIPVSRHGSQVKYHNLKDTQTKLKTLISRIKELQDNGYKNIAIIAKDADKCSLINNKLKEKGILSNLISNELVKYNGGLTVVPSYLSKGLEFDNVIIFDIEKYELNSLDIKLLYVAYTRAMHTLDVL